MKKTILFATVIVYLSLSLAGHFYAPATASASPDSKVQPKGDILLNKNAKTAKTPDKNTVPFNHENHSLKNYAADLKSVARCAECHHTDQPKELLKGVLKTSERAVDLTTPVLDKPDSAPVKSCQSCHAQTDVKPSGWPANPVVEYEDEGEVTLNNEEAYHRNCITCHEAVKKIKPDTTAVTSCAGCHSGK
jgi:cytochrome c553